jgi:hypothetical protein
MVAAQSQNNGGGTCDIGVHYNLAKQQPQTNQADSVVLDARALQLTGKLNVPISWGAGNAPVAGAKLIVRFVKYAPGCQNATVDSAARSFTVNVPAFTDYIVVSATEGTVQPWFTI